MHETYGFALAVFTFAIVFGAFAGQCAVMVAMNSVPRGQLETAEAYGMTHRQTFWRILVPQMWVYALPGLSNLWMVLDQGHAASCSCWVLKTSSIGRASLGGSKMARFTDYPHGDWRMWYFLVLLVFYLAFTRVSEIVLAPDGTTKLSHGQATVGGEAQRKAA